MSNKERMLKDISILDFVLVELMLYMDTHPYDRGAMEHFNHYSRMKNQMSKEFSREYFPLTKDMAGDCDKEWRWGSAPLPWEGVNC